MRIAYIERYHPSDIPLYDAISHLRAANEWLHDVAHSLFGVWLLGDYLARPFLHMWSGGVWALIYLYEFNAAIATNLNWIISILAAFGKIVDIEEAIENFWVLVHNPALWVAYQIKKFFPELFDFINSSGSWIMGKIDLLYPDLLIFLHNPPLFIWHELLQYFPLLRELWPDPFPYLLERGIQAFPHLHIFLEKPAIWLRGEIYSLWPELRSFYENPGYYIESYFKRSYPKGELLLRNPGYYILDIMADSLESHYPKWHERLSRLGERIIRYIWEREW